MQNGNLHIIMLKCIKHETLKYEIVKLIDIIFIEIMSGSQ